MRKVLFDIADGSGESGTNGKFDEWDIIAFLEEFEFYENQRLNNGAVPDYLGYDLNGDGYTGGSQFVTRFDLDVVNPAVYGNVNLEIDSTMRTFNENLVSDLDILCYYANTALYEGDLTLRDSLMVNCAICAPIANLISYVSRTGYLEATAYCTECTCTPSAERDSVPKPPSDVFGNWSGQVSADFSCPAYSCAGSAQAGISSGPVFDATSNRWVFTATGQGSASYQGTPPFCGALNYALEEWVIEISDSCEMKYTLNLSIDSGDLSFQGANDDAQEYFNASILYPGGDTTVVGTLAPGTFRFNYLAGGSGSAAGVANDFSVELIIELSQPSRRLSREPVVKTSYDSKEQPTNLKNMD